MRNSRHDSQSTPALADATSTRAGPYTPPHVTLTHKCHFKGFAPCRSEPVAAQVEELDARVDGEAFCNLDAAVVGYAVTSEAQNLKLA